MTKEVAFGELYKTHFRQVRGLCRQLLGSPERAEDAAQEAFIRAYRALPNFRGDSQFYTWLHRIAVNTAKNHLVAQNRRPPTDDVDAADAEQYDSGTRLREMATPENELLRQEIELAVMRAVEALPDELRMAINLREVDGMSYEEIAARMDCPIGTVRSRIFRAREAIDNELRPLLDHDTNLRERAHR
jgi:RNA polymerase sigma-70 factor (ECF subfamily)